MDKIEKYTSRPANIVIDDVDDAKQDAEAEARVRAKLADLYINRFRGIPLIEGDENLPLTSKQVIFHLLSGYKYAAFIVRTNPVH